ncbi:MAG: hypothetical protein ACYC69_02970 [Thermodesulfovibrionales bacterium]
MFYFWFFAAFFVIWYLVSLFFRGAAFAIRIALKVVFLPLYLIAYCLGVRTCHRRPARV